MTIPEFLDPEDATPEGIVYIGGDLRPRALFAAYEKGIFRGSDAYHPSRFI